MKNEINLHLLAFRLFKLNVIEYGVYYYLNYLGNKIQ